MPAEATLAGGGVVADLAAGTATGGRSGRQRQPGRHREPPRHVLQRPARRQRRGQPAGRGGRRRRAGRAWRRRPVRLQLHVRQHAHGAGPDPSISAARRATRSTCAGSTPTSGRRTATRRSISSARPSSRAPASCASFSRTATRSSRPTRTGPRARK